MPSPRALYLRLHRGYSRLRRRQRFLAGFLTVALLVAARPIYLSLPAKFSLGSSVSQLYFVLPSDPPSPGQAFTVELRVRTGSQAVNAVGSTITVNPHVLEILSMTTSSSFCSFYAENSFDTIRGEVHISCGTPNPGFSGDSTVVQISLRSRISGTTTIAVKPDSAQVLANDGKGTNLVGEAPQAEITIKQTF